MSSQSMILFGARGYVGGTIAAAARESGMALTEVVSSEFDIWADPENWPHQLIGQSADVAVLAASFEKPVSRGEFARKSELFEKFAELIDCIRAHRIIFLSSDAVFNGMHGPYMETSIQSPSTMYGRCKVAMEQIVLCYPNAHVVRMSVVWGAGAVKSDSRRARYLKLPNEQIKGSTNVFRSPVGVQQVAQAIIRIAEEENPPKILHLATPRMSYFEFLRNCLLGDTAVRIVPWVDPMYEHGIHDSSLRTNHPELVSRLLA